MIEIYGYIAPGLLLLFGLILVLFRVQYAEFIMLAAAVLAIPKTLILWKEQDSNRN